MIKNYSYLLVLALSFYSVSSFAQATATASTTAQVITPIAITKTTDMNFGTLASGTTLGTVVLDTNNGRTRTGGITLSTSGTAAASAVFGVTGQANSAFAITLPTSITLSDGATTPNTMIVDAFTSIPATNGTLSAGGSATINVGATLNVKASQIAGTYTNASDLAVTVNYN